MQELPRGNRGLDDAGVREGRFSASNETPPFMLHVVVGWAFSVIAAVVAFRILLMALEIFR
jgi:hypothetical protein